MVISLVLLISYIQIWFLSSLAVFSVSYRIAASPCVASVWVLVVCRFLLSIGWNVTVQIRWPLGRSYCIERHMLLLLEFKDYFLLRFLRLLSLVVQMVLFLFMWSWCENGFNPLLLLEVCNGFVLSKDRLDLRRPCICGRMFGYLVIYRAFSTLFRIWFVSLKISSRGWLYQQCLLSLLLAEARRCWLSFFIGYLLTSRVSLLIMFLASFIMPTGILLFCLRCNQISYFLLYINWYVILVIFAYVSTIYEFLQNYYNLICWWFLIFIYFS